MVFHHSSYTKPGRESAVDLIKEIHHIGSGNKGWINCINEGGYTNAYYQNVSTWRNTDANDMVVVYGVPLPVTKTLDGTTYDLIITRVKVGIFDADDTDYVSTLKLYQMKYDSANLFWSDSTDYKTPQEVTYDNTDMSLNGYERACVRVDCTNGGALELDITHVEVEYYYG